MAERAVFLDRDNTIIENDGYLGDPARVKLLPGAATALASIRALGYRLIVVSNQSGVARGMFDEAAVEAVNDEMSRQLRQQADAYIDASYYCPYHPEAPVAEYRVDHDWRKPRPGMLRQAAADFNLDLSQCWMIGDQDRDIAAGAGAGCRTILLKDGDRGPATDAEVLENGATTAVMTVSPSFVVRTLADAARILAREGRNPPHPLPSAVPAGAAKSAASPSPAAPTPLPSAVPQPAATVRSEPRVPTPAPVKTEPAPAGLEAQRSRVNGSSPAPPASSPQLEQKLDELVVQLRQQNRNAELRPDFSFSAMAAIILQAFAVIALVVGLANYFTAKATYTKLPDDYFIALITHLSAATWVLVAMVIEGMVIALQLHNRRR